MLRPTTSAETQDAPEFVPCPVCRKVGPVYADGGCVNCTKRKFSRIDRPQPVTRAATGKRRRWTTEEDDLLRREYDGTWRTAQGLAWKLSRSFHAIKGRVQALGLTLAKHADWAPEEVAYLEANFQAQPVGKMADHLGRSRTAVTVKLKRLRLLRRGTRDGWYTERDAAALLGMDTHKLHRYIRAGQLPARSHYERDTGQDGMSAWHIDAADLREFIIRHAHQVSGRNVDMAALVSLLTDQDAQPKRTGTRTTRRG